MMSLKLELTSDCPNCKEEIQFGRQYLFTGVNDETILKHAVVTMTSTINKIKNPEKCQKCLASPAYKPESNERILV